MASALLLKRVWHPLPLVTGRDAQKTTPFAGQPRPSWMVRGYQGVVVFGDRLYLCRETETDEDGHTVQVLASVPLDEATLEVMASHLGRIMIFPGFTRAGEGGRKDGAQGAVVDPDAHLPEIDWVMGGTVPASSFFLEPKVFFSVPLSAMSWSTRTSQQLPMVVVSRAKQLYDRLFETSAGIGQILRSVLIGMTLAFGLLEMLALWLAIRLSCTITGSVASLYRGTTEIDKGNLDFRVKAERRDQFGPFAASFNRMAGSIQELLVQQREKDRLLSELAIAQGVQQSLFPPSPVRLPGLELHAACLPARSVSGDYFDFIYEKGEARSGDGPDDLMHSASEAREGPVCLALAISAAKGSRRRCSWPRRTPRCGRSVPAIRLRIHPPVSPALLLEQLNRHLYSSTQANKYATLFVAMYDRRSRELTYSNGGHLPPMLFSADGSLRRLTCGGPWWGCSTA